MQDARSVVISTIFAPLAVKMFWRILFYKSLKDDIVDTKGIIQT